ncbi:MAG: hypothetical protein IMF19_12015 [Proteobacteria bacterium]|nr:hypothetical protein [Pseudomonadota bacterium]
MKISEFNINFGNIDNAHVAIIKAQLESGVDIPIRFYMKDGHKWVIDGGHTLTAYQELGKEPPIQMEVQFTTPEDLIALSRHCNVNRLIQKPITYTESITAEVKLRLELTNDELMPTFAKYTTVQQRGDASVAVSAPRSEQVLTDIFKNERITVSTFRSEYLPLLKLPNEFKDAIDTGKLAKTLGSELARIKEPRKQEELGRIAQEEQLSLSEMKEIKHNLEESDCSINHATAEVLEARAFKRRHRSPEGILKTMRSKAREGKQEVEHEGTLTEFAIKCLKCHKEITIQHIEPSGKHRLKVDPLSEPYGARITEEIDEYITGQTKQTGKTRGGVATDLMRAGFAKQMEEGEDTVKKTDMARWELMDMV